MSWKAIPIAAIVVAAGAFAGAVQAHPGPGTFSSASASAGSGFVVNGTLTETGLPAGSAVDYVWSSHVVVGMVCGGKTVMDRIGKVTGTISATADESGTAGGSFSITLPALSCANGATADPVKMIVRSIKMRDVTNHHRTETHGWYISKDSKGFTSATPFGG